MKPINNWNDVKPSGDFTLLEPGGYVLKILSATNVPDKEYLEILYDIAEGPEKGRYGGDWGKEHPYSHRLIRSYKEKAVGMFKAFINAIEASNAGYTWAWEEKTLKGKLFGAVIGLEEYMNDFGEIKNRLAVRSIKKADDIRQGNFTVPDIKRYKPKDDVPLEAPPAGFTDDPDIPF